MHSVMERMSKEHQKKWQSSVLICGVQIKTMSWFYTSLCKEDQKYWGHSMLGSSEVTGTHIMLAGYEIM